MMAEHVLEMELHLVEDELRRVAKVIVPGDERVRHDNLALAQQPIDDGVVVVARGVDRHAGDAQAAARVAPNRKLRAVEDKLAQAKLEQRQ